MTIRLRSCQTSNKYPPPQRKLPSDHSRQEKEGRWNEWTVLYTQYLYSDKFKGYEIFYDTPDDPDFEPVVKGKFLLSFFYVNKIVQ